ncbi:MAG: hypothetical protein IJO97_02970 [Lachnospiraceae bacterium]|nr:hypothetical protein [Lachnospiraceae bacterium]
MEKLREGKLSRLYYWIFMLVIMLIAVFLLLVPPAMIDELLHFYRIC